MDCLDGSKVPHISKSIQKVLDLRLDSKETLEALKELSTFFPKNTGENRRKLYSTVIERILVVHEDFLKSLKTVHDTLDEINEDVKDMNGAVREMTSKLSSTKTKTRKLIDQTTHLQKQMAEVDTKQHIATALCEKFLLKPSEILAIKSGTVSREMLDAMNRCLEIKANCHILTQAGCKTLSEDIIREMSLLFNMGIEHLFKWAQSRCRTIEQSDPKALLPAAMEKLQHKENYLDQILEEYSTNRRDMLVRQLIAALTRGGNPIEHRVTQPKRYIGDMLAWLHQAVPIERDNLVYMLKMCEDVDVADKIQKSLCSITEGVSHPLRVRIEHILLGENNLRDPLLLLEILSLLRYYHEIVHQIVGSGILGETLATLLDTSKRTLLMSLTARVALLLGSDVEMTPTDLSVTPGVSKVLTLLSQVLATESSNATLVSEIVSCVLDPTFAHITERAAKLPPVETAVFLLNCLHACEVVLALHPFLDERLERLKAQSEAQMDTLTSEQASVLVAHLGLGAIYAALQGSPTRPLSQLPAFDSSHLSNISVKLHKLLVANEMYLLPQLPLLNSTTCRLAIEKRAGTVLHGIYKDLYEAVYNVENQFQEPEELLPILPENVLAAFIK